MSSATSSGSATRGKDGSVLLWPSKLSPSLGQNGSSQSSQPPPPPSKVGIGDAESRTATGLLRLFGKGPLPFIPTLNSSTSFPSVGTGTANPGRCHQNPNCQTTAFVFPGPLHDLSNALSSSTSPNIQRLETATGVQDDNLTGAAFRTYKKNAEAELKQRNDTIETLKGKVEACQMKMLEMRLEKELEKVSASRESLIFQEMQRNIQNLLHKVNSFTDAFFLPSNSNHQAFNPDGGVVGPTTTENMEGDGSKSKPTLDELLVKLNSLEGRLASIESSNEDLLATCKSTADSFKEYVIHTSEKLDRIVSFVMAEKRVPGPGSSVSTESIQSNSSLQTQPPSQPWPFSTCQPSRPSSPSPPLQTFAENLPPTKNDACAVQASETVNTSLSLESVQFAVQENNLTQDENQEEEEEEDFQSLEIVLNSEPSSPLRCHSSQSSSDVPRSPRVLEDNLSQLTLTVTVITSEAQSQMGEITLNETNEMDESEDEDQVEESSSNQAAVNESMEVPESEGNDNEQMREVTSNDILPNEAANESDSNGQSEENNSNEVMQNEVVKQSEANDQMKESNSFKEIMPNEAAKESDSNGQSEENNFNEVMRNEAVKQSDVAANDQMNESNSFKEIMVDGAAEESEDREAQVHEVVVECEDEEGDKANDSEDKDLGANEDEEVGESKLESVKGHLGDTVEDSDFDDEEDEMYDTDFEEESELEDSKLDEAAEESEFEGEDSDMDDLEEDSEFEDEDDHGDDAEEDSQSEGDEHESQKDESELLKRFARKRKRLVIESSDSEEEDHSQEQEDEYADDDGRPPVLSLPCRIVKDPKRRLTTMPILLPEIILEPRQDFNNRMDEKRWRTSLTQMLEQKQKQMKSYGNVFLKFRKVFHPGMETSITSSAPEQMASEGARRLVVGIRSEKEASKLEHRHARDFSKAGYACLCGAKFTGAGGLYVHQVKNMEHEKFFCNLCGKRFHYFSGLKAHRKTTHKMEFTAEVGCSRCGQVFHSKKERQGHRDARGQTCWLSGAYQSKNWELIRSRHSSGESSSRLSFSISSSKNGNLTI